MQEVDPLNRPQNLGGEQQEVGIGNLAGGRQDILLEEVPEEVQHASQNQPSGGVQVAEKKAFEFPSWSKHLITGAKVAGVVAGVAIGGPIALALTPVVVVGVAFWSAGESWSNAAHYLENEAQRQPTMQLYTMFKDEAEEAKKKALFFQTTGNVLAAPLFGIKKCLDL